MPLPDEIPVIRVEQLSKSFGSAQVLHDVTFSVNRREVIGIIGPSGSGKSTILRCITFLERPSGGRIFLGDQEIGMTTDPQGRRKPMRQAELARYRRRMCMVFQAFHLWPHRTALENVIEGLVVVKRMARQDAVKIGRALLARVGLENKEDAYPSRLSGGQQQRVAIARALAMEPDVLLFDEPTSALDPELIGEVLEVMGDLARSGATMVVVTHEMGFAHDACNRILFMDGGRIVDDGSPAHILDTSANPRTRDFLQRYNRNPETLRL